MFYRWNSIAQEAPFSYGAFGLLIFFLEFFYSKLVGNSICGYSFLCYFLFFFLVFFLFFLQNSWHLPNNFRKRSLFKAPDNQFVFFSTARQDNGLRFGRKNSGTIPSSWLLLLQSPCQRFLVQKLFFVSSSPSENEKRLESCNLVNFCYVFSTI